VKVPDYDIIGPVVSVGGLTPTQEGLISAGKVFPGAHVCESQIHPDLMKMATRHAKYQADHRQQGHQLFASRVAELRKTMGNSTFAEIAAESWREQSGDSTRALGDEMFKSWRQSSGHWSVASKKHVFFGADMAMGSDNIWYACIIVAN
jgi:acetyl-CoA carboxylase carboxyltransferase component